MSAFDDLLNTVPTGIWINGTPRPSSSGTVFDVLNPASGDKLASVADGTTKDARDAISASSAVAEEWADTAPRVRSDILRRAYDLVIERRAQFAALITLEMGKPLSESLGEVAYGAEFLRWFSEEAVRINGRATTAPAGNGEIRVTKEPVGLCLAVTPWNFPLAMGTRKIGPALAAGCTMILKPSEDTPLTMLLLAATLAEAGLPPGVLSVLPTTNAVDVVAELMRDPTMRKVSFTGSTQVGQKLIAQSAERVLRTSMELGGNAPFLVFDDADLEAAVAGAVAAKMRNGGQACTAANRILVQNSVREEFTRRLATRIGALQIGRGWEDGVAVGPVINDGQLNRIATLVDGAVAAGARVHTGGSRITGPGSFYAPTVLADVPEGNPILSEEIFGPVAVVTGFDSEEDGIESANSTDYGLAAYFYSSDPSRIQRVARRIEAGMVGVNRGVISDPAAPFGGVKMSGVGSEGGSEGINEYLNTKYLALPPSI